MEVRGEEIWKKYAKEGKVEKKKSMNPQHPMVETNSYKNIKYEFISLFLNRPFPSVPYCIEWTQNCCEIQIN